MAKKRSHIEDCPFCTSPWRLLKIFKNSETNSYRIICTVCGSGGPARVTEKLAIVGWNKSKLIPKDCTKCGSSRSLWCDSEIKELKGRAAGNGRIALVKNKAEKMIDEALLRVVQHVDARKKVLKVDSRLKAKPAFIDVNAPLAIIQIELGVELKTLEQIETIIEGGR
ncbi:hypothetical protein KAR91_32450 [Candidatus Pacearchaeota archaeon]|nr:hypothetical protein [Candidatus Pacearchaeota archaeon]